MIKKVLITFVISLALIIFLSPYINDYEENKKYDFTVNTNKGEISKKDFKGKVLAVYFGYSFCPDVCPTSLSTLAAALNTFDKSKQDNLSAVFISLDPQRDTLSNLEEYSKYFHKNFIGSTSSKENLDLITKNYNTYYKIIEQNNSAIKYTVSHTSYIYIFTKDGKLHKIIKHFSDINEVKKVLDEVL